MLLLYFYCILGFTNLHIITCNKKLSNSIIDIQDYSYNILYTIYSLSIFSLLMFSFIYDFIYNNNINFGFILYKLNFISQFIILYFKYHKIIKYKFYDVNNFYNINLYSQSIIFILSIPYIYIIIILIFKIIIMLHLLLILLIYLDYLYILIAYCYLY